MEKDFQDIQQLDSEENDHQPSGDEEQGTHGQNPRTENPFWKGKCPVSGALPRSPPQLSASLSHIDSAGWVYVCQSQGNYCCDKNAMTESSSERKGFIYKTP